MLVLSGAVLTAIYVLYIDIIMEKGIGIHQLPGIVKKIFGKKARDGIAMFLLFGRAGIMFLYTIIIADFSTILLKNILGLEISKIFVSLIITFLLSIAIARNIKFVAKLSLSLSMIILVILSLTSVTGILAVHTTDPGTIQLFLSSRPDMSLREILHLCGALYGVSLGALSGLAAIPSLKELVPEELKIRSIVITGTLIALVIYALFALFISTFSSTITEDALTGLGNFWWVDMLAVAGLLCIITSYLGIGNSLYEVFTLDYSLPKYLSWLLTFAPAATLYVIGIRSFIYMATLIGSVVGGIEGITIIACYWGYKIKTGARFSLKQKIMIVCLGMILVAGIILSL